MLRSRDMPSFVYLECHCSLFRSSELCTRTLATGGCKSERRELQSSADVTIILDLDSGIDRF